MFFSILVSAGLLSLGLPVGTDVPVTDSLHAVTVTADRGVVVSRTDTLSVSDRFSISDVINSNPSLHLGDNGGYAGLKTVSLRGMGSAHTSVYIDGVKVGNVQSGQNDLGMTGLENYGSAVVDYAQNSILFHTLRPVFGKSPVAGKARFYAGSFGTYLPSARLDFRLSENLALSANAAGIISKGDYPYGDGLRRENNDVSQVRAGLDLFGVMSGGDYHVKAYYNGTDRGTPGSTDWPSEDRQKDMNVFLQGSLRKNFSSLYTLHLSAKGSYDDIYYTSSWGDSRYGQTEVQVNSAHLFRVSRWLGISLAADLQWDGLRSTSYDASRFTVLTALASSFRTGRFSADLALEYNGAFDADALSRSAFSPSLDMRFGAFEGFDVVAFARRAYRIPVFNELYYVGYGNPELKPEDAWMTDLGIDFNRQAGDDWRIKAKADGFLYLLSDKITSAPTPEDPAVWQPYNIGKVRSAGVDISAGAEYRSGSWICALNAGYTFLSAKDMTPDSSTYGSQIPYVARNTLMADAVIAWKGWSLNPVWQLRAGRTDGYGALPDWDTLNCGLSKSFSFGKAGTLTAILSVRNILDEHYEIVSGYPMPGRNMIFGVEYKF